MHGLEHDEGQQMEMEEQERSESLEKEEQCGCQHAWKYNPVSNHRICVRCGLIANIPKLTDPGWREYHQKQRDKIKQAREEINKIFDGLLK